jgi:ABC-type bacteriocin/lantibiotic exporter with double-glycine peptidase domain
MGRPISDDQIMQLARELELEEFLRSWPGQLDSAILEGGRNLSGGQKQRLGLLRTLVGSPAIVLLDEPEKNLDHQSLGALVDYVKGLKQRCTCVIATHCSAFDAVVDMTFDFSGKVV